MSGLADRRARSRWMLAVFVAFIFSPAPIAAAVLVAAALIVAGGTVVRARAPRAERLERTRRAADATWLGADRRGKPVLLDDRQLSAHGLILGASGAGKSTTLLAILTDRIRRGMPVIAIDMKGSPAFAARLAEAAAGAGRRFRLWTADGPDHWNPLQHGNSTELKDKLIATERFTEPHYKRAAERYVQTALRVLQEAHPERPATLEDVVDAMDPRKLAVHLRNLPLERSERIQDYLATLSPDQLSAIRGLATRLAVISESDTAPFLSPPAGGRSAIDLRAAIAGEEVVVFSLNSSSYGGFAAQLGTLAVQDLVAAVGHTLAHGGRSPAQPALIGVDEFSALGAENVIALLARGREAGVSVVVATQELADLERAGRGLRDQVLGNTAVKIAHRQEVPSSALAIAQMAGTVKRWEETRQLGGGLFGGYETGGGTRRQVEGYRVDPNQIKTLRTGEAVMIVKQPRASVRTLRVTPPPDRGGPER